MAAVRSQMDGLTGSLRSFEKGTQGLVKGAAFGMGAGVVVAQAQSMIKAASDVADDEGRVQNVPPEFLTASASPASRAATPNSATCAGVMDTLLATACRSAFTA